MNRLAWWWRLNISKDVWDRYDQCMFDRKIGIYRNVYK